MKEPVEMDLMVFFSGNSFSTILSQCSLSGEALLGSAFGNNLFFRERREKVYSCEKKQLVASNVFSLGGKKYDGKLAY